jgi:tRNA(Ile2) C34 agmatinyltransferase TiaS
VHGADARAGEHRVDRFGDHRQVDADAVALLHAVAAQHVREPADLLVQLAVGDVLVLAGLVGDPQDRGLLTALDEMAVDAVEARVELATEEPRRPRPCAKSCSQARSNGWNQLMRCA